MTFDEKKWQIGQAVSEYQEAKVELAHIEKKIERTFAVYRELGKSTAATGTFEIASLIRSGTGEPLGGKELVATLTERDEARDKAAAAVKKLRDLGITCVE